MSKSWKNAGLANKQLLWSSKIMYTLIKPSRCPFEKKLALSISYQMMKPPPQTLVHFEVISGVELFCWPVSGPDAGCNTSGDIVSNEEQCNSSSLLHSLDCRCTWEFLAILVTEQHLKHCMWSFNSFLHSVKQVGRRMGSTAKWTVFSRITSTFPTCFFSTSKDWISYCGYICLYSFGRSPTIMLYHKNDCYSSKQNLDHSGLGLTVDKVNKKTNGRKHTLYCSLYCEPAESHFSCRFICSLTTIGLMLRWVSK